MSEARDRLELAGTENFDDFHRDSLRFVNRYALDRFLARPDDLIAVVIETLTCETCEGSGEQWVSWDHADKDDCTVCNGSKLDPVKVQAVLRQFADAGVLTRVTHRHPNWHIERYGREVSTPTFDERFVSPWVPSGAPE